MPGSHVFGPPTRPLAMGFCFVVVVVVIVVGISGGCHIISTREYQYPSAVSPARFVCKTWLASPSDRDMARHPFTCLPFDSNRHPLLVSLIRHGSETASNVSGLVPRHVGPPGAELGSYPMHTLPRSSRGHSHGSYRIHTRWCLSTDS